MSEQLCVPRTKNTEMHQSGALRSMMAGLRPTDCWPSREPAIINAVFINGGVNSTVIAQHFVRYGACGRSDMTPATSYMEQ